MLITMGAFVKDIVELHQHLHFVLPAVALQHY